MLIKHWFGSLVNRAVALVVVVILVSALAVTLVGSLFSRAELEQQSKGQVETIARLVADSLDDRLGLRLNLLNHVAQSLSTGQEDFLKRAPELLARQVAVRHLFDGVYLISASGQVLAEYPQDYRQTGLNVRDREYFTRVSTSLTPVVSEPYASNYQGKPAIMVAAPVFDSRQQFIGLIGGAILLEGPNFMEEVASVHIGDTGRLSVVTRTGVVLADSLTGKVMVPVRVGNPVFLDAMEGTEGTWTSSGGAEEGDAIISVRQMALVPWFVTATWPAREAFAPLSRMTTAFAWTLLLVIVVFAPLALWVFRRLLAPLQHMGQQIHERHLGIRKDPVAVSGGREIRQVAEIFNTVMDERDEVLESLAEREAFFRSLTQSAPIGIVQTDVLGRIEFVNPAFEALMGLSAQELQHSYLARNICQEDRGMVLRGWHQAQTRHEVFRERLRLAAERDGRVIQVDAMTAAIEMPDKVLGTISVVRDITRELEVEEALKEEQQRAENILGVLQEGVVMIEASGKIRYANDAACRYLGTGSGCAGQNFFDRISIRYGERLLSREDFLAGADMDNVYATLSNADGAVFDIDLTLLHIRQGRLHERMVFVLRDDSVRRREEERLSWEASHDSLTHLLNRRAFMASLVQCLNEAPLQEACSVLMVIDLDHFKPVNDQGGHLLGDDLLRRLAELFRDSVRKSDMVARLGGDEFGIILPACGLDRAQALAEHIRTGVENLRIRQDGRSFGVTASIGLTDMSALDSGPREVMARADEGSYIAKSRGRNQVIVVPAPPDDPVPVEL